MREWQYVRCTPHVNVSHLRCTPCRHSAYLRLVASTFSRALGIVLTVSGAVVATLCSRGCPAPPPSTPRLSLVVCHPLTRHAHVQPARSWLPSALGSPSSAISVAAASSTSSAPRTLSSTKRADSEGEGWQAGGHHSLLSPVYACCCDVRSSWPLVLVEVCQRAVCCVSIDCGGGLAQPQGCELLAFRSAVAIETAVPLR